MLRLLVAEGNTYDGRCRIAESAGATPTESYADVLRLIAPDAQVDIFTPADEGATLPAPLDAYDGIAIGSSLPGRSMPGKPPSPPRWVLWSRISLRVRMRLASHLAAPCENAG
jgi:hypothetical protein